MSSLPAFGANSLSINWCALLAAYDTRLQSVGFYGLNDIMQSIKHEQVIRFDSEMIAPTQGSIILLPVRHVSPDCEPETLPGFVRVGNNSSTLLQFTADWTHPAEKEWRKEENVVIWSLVKDGVPQVCIMLASAHGEGDAWPAISVSVPELGSGKRVLNYI